MEVFMKKKVISFWVMFLLAFLPNGLFAVELWNGFSSEMRIDDVKNRARSVLELDNYKESLSGGNWTGGDAQIFSPQRSNRRHLNATLPPYESYMRYIAPDEKAFGSVTFFFRNNLLFVVWVYPRLYIEEFLPFARNHYGQITETFVEEDPGIPGNGFASPWRRTWYRWQTQGKIIYTNGGISGNNRGYAPLIIFEQQAVANYTRELQEPENRRREQATSGFSF